MTNNRFLTNQSVGVTLIETVIAVSISSILVLAPVTALFMYTVRANPDLYAKSQIPLQFRLAMEEVGKLVTQAVQLEAVYGSYTSHSGNLILKVPSIDQTKQIIPNTFDYVVFQGALERLFPAPGSARPTVSRRLIDQPVLALYSYYQSDGNQVLINAGNASQIERVGVSFSKQTVVNGQNKNFSARRQYSLRNH